MNKIVLSLWCMSWGVLPISPLTPSRTEAFISPGAGRRGTTLLSDLPLYGEELPCLRISLHLVTVDMFVYVCPIQDSTQGPPELRVPYGLGWGLYWDHITVQLLCGSFLSYFPFGIDDVTGASQICFLYAHLSRSLLSWGNLTPNSLVQKKFLELTWPPLHTHALRVHT